MRHICFKYSQPFVDEKGNFLIDWEGEILKVVGITETAWIVTNF